jgi:hypothetical protein
MGAEEIKLPHSPVGWAIHLTKVIKAFSDAHGVSRFPIDVTAIARDYSISVFPSEPITLVEGKPFGRNFEGALIRKPGTSEWGIFYNSAISSVGRKNFTLAHELGHYLLHRAKSADEILCQKSDMWAWDSEYGIREADANQFASFLLMPRDDFEIQTANFHRPQIVDFEPLRDRYGVSITAAILKWLEITTKRAMIVVSHDGFIDWAWSSKPLLKSGVFLKPKQSVIAIPAKSLAAMVTDDGVHDPVQLPIGVWSQRETVMESVLLSEYHGLTISLLIYPNTPPPFQPRLIEY